MAFSAGYGDGNGWAGGALPAKDLVALIPDSSPSPGAGLYTAGAPLVRTANMIIKFGDLVRSAVCGFPDHCMCYDHRHGMERSVGASCAGSLFADGAISASDAVVQIPNEIFVVDLIAQFLNGSAIPEISIKTLGIIQTQNVLIRERLYETCHIVGYKEEKDGTVWVKFRFCSTHATMTEYDQEGIKQGNNRCGFNLSSAATLEEDGGGEEG